MRESEKTNAWLAASILLIAAIPARSAELPPPATHKISFSRDIKPIFEASCIKCHGRGRDKGNFRLDTRGTLIKGGDSGASVTPGRSADSYLIQLVAGTDPDNVMPQKGSRLTVEQVALMRAWIDQGIPWEEGVTFGRKVPINLFPRRPEIPAGVTGLRMGNPIDAFLKPYFAEHGVTPNEPVSDRVFARRAFLDVIGVLPTPSEVQELQLDNRADKRERLVVRLLADSQRYAEHWLSFWNDLLRNDYRGTGYIDGGRKQITRWLYSALATNMPYDRFVAELVNPAPESEGFTKGIIWRGVVNASQTPPMQAAQNISQVFMGVNLKCASCHDSFINDWTLADAYGLASIYADESLEMVVCDKPTGKFAAMRFLYPELGSLNPDSPKSERLQQLAELITQKQNGRLSRTIVNRLWAEFFGQGLVEPVDDMETHSWNPDLLDWLAVDLVESGYNPKTVISRILTSRAYQMATVASSPTQHSPYVFRGPQVRRLSAEQFRDALTSITGVGFDLPATDVDSSISDSSRAPEPESLEQSAKAQWIWNDSSAADNAPVETLYFRKRVFLAEEPATATIVATCDNSFQLYINGEKAGTGNTYSKPAIFNMGSRLIKGENIVAVAATNGKGSKSEENTTSSNPAGFFLYARVRNEKTIQAQAGKILGGAPSNQNSSLLAQAIPVETVMDFISDSSWIWSNNEAEGWTRTEFAPDGWKHAVELGDSAVEPWKLNQKLSESIATSNLSGKVRASLAHADPLTTALGRPNRDQLMTQRSSLATTLQALELTNGDTLSGILARGTKNLIRNSPPSASSLVDNLYNRALLRPPTRQERKLSESLVGSPIRHEGVEDLLWAIGMLPEFQLIY